MKTTAALAILVLASLGLAQEKEEKEKPINLVEVAGWSRSHDGFLRTAKNPLVRKDLVKKRQEEYENKVKGKPVEGVGQLTSMNVQGKSVTLYVRVNLGGKDTMLFSVHLKNGDDPVLKTLKPGGKDPSTVQISGVMPSDTVYSSVTTVYDGKVTIPK